MHYNDRCINNVENLIYLLTGLQLFYHIFICIDVQLIVQQLSNSPKLPINGMYNYVKSHVAAGANKGHTTFNTYWVTRS